MFWESLILIFKASIPSLLVLYMFFFVFGVIATKVNIKTSSESSYISLVGNQNGRKNTLFYAALYIIVLAIALSWGNSIFKWIVAGVFALFLLNDLVHFVIEIVSIFAAPKKEKAHVLLYSIPAAVSLYVWGSLGYIMLSNFDLL